MKHPIYRLLYFAVLFCVSLPAAGAQTPWLKAIENNLRAEGFLAPGGPMKLKDRMEHYGVPGVAIAVIRDGRLAEVSGFGVLATSWLMVIPFFLWVP